MAKNPSAFSVNERIQHEDYGPGTITEIGPSTTTIEFDQAGRRKFVSSIVRLQRSDVAAPERRAKKTPARKRAAGATKSKK